MSGRLPLLRSVCCLGSLLMTYALPQYFISRLQTRRSPAGRSLLGTIVVGLLVLIFGLANNDPYKLRFPNMTSYYPGGQPGLVDLRRAVSGPSGERRSHRRRQEARPRRYVARRRCEALKNWLAVVKTGRKAPADRDQTKAGDRGHQRRGGALGVLVGRRARPPGSSDPWIRQARADHHRCVGRNGRGRLLRQAQAGQSGSRPAR